MASDKPTQFPELNQLLQGWVEATSEILDNNFVGAYLVGSFALGDADIHSDCHFLVVVRNSLTPARRQGFERSTEQIFRRPGHWTQHLEGSYAPENELRSLDGLGNRWLFLDNAHKEMEWSTHCNSLEHRWTLRERGIILAGPCPKGLVEKVDPEAIREKMRPLIQTFLPELAGLDQARQHRMGSTLCCGNALPNAIQHRNRRDGIKASVPSMSQGTSRSGVV
jgi:hypothetical protein